jgi:hypothetical protein
MKHKIKRFVTKELFWFLKVLRRKKRRKPTLFYRRDVAETDVGNEKYSDRIGENESAIFDVSNSDRIDWQKCRLMFISKNILHGYVNQICWMTFLNYKNQYKILICMFWAIRMVQVLLHTYKHKLVHKWVRQSPISNAFLNDEVIVGTIYLNSTLYICRYYLILFIK